jgi:hypothetical protein
MEGYRRDATGDVAGSNSVERCPIDRSHATHESETVKALDGIAL